MPGDDGRNGGLEGGVKLSDLISRYDGTGDVTEWLEQLEIAKGPARITDLAQVLPAFLRGDAFKVYKNLSAETKRDFKAVSEALTTAFGVDENVAFCTLVSRRWRDGEAVDVYVAELRRLASLSNTPERVVRLVFLNGLPEKVGLQLKTTPNIRDMAMEQVLDLARRLMAAAPGPLAPGPLPGPTSVLPGERRGHWEVGAAASEDRLFRCFGCSGEGHMVRNCPSTNRKSSKQSKRQRKKAQKDQDTNGSATGSENEGGLS